MNIRQRTLALLLPTVALLAGCTAYGYDDHPAGLYGNYEPGYYGRVPRYYNAYGYGRGRPYANDGRQDLSRREVPNGNRGGNTIRGPVHSEPHGDVHAGGFGGDPHHEAAGPGSGTGGAGPAVGGAGPASGGFQGGEHR